MTLLPYTLAEFYRLRRTWLPWAHLLLPLTYALLAGAACRFTGLQYQAPLTVIEGYLELLGGLLPVIIGLVTAGAADMEASAGQFQLMLSCPGARRTAMLGKVCCLLLSACGSLLIAVGFFRMLYGSIPAFSWWPAALLIFLGCMFSYLLHVWVSFQAGSGASVGLSFAESLLAFLALTGLGDGIWYYIPCTWAARFSATLIQMCSQPGQLLYYMELRRGVLTAAPMTIALLAVLLIWFSRWDGRSSVD